MYFSVRVCGSEVIDTTGKNYVEVLALSTDAATQYHTVNQASFEVDFMMPPVSEVCNLVSYELVSSYTDSTTAAGDFVAWDHVTDPQVLFPGVLGTYELLVDRSFEHDTTLSIMATTRGLVRNAIQYQFVVCDPVGVIQSPSFAIVLQYTVVKDDANPIVTKPTTDWENQLSFTGLCAYCTTHLMFDLYEADLVTPFNEPAITLLSPSLDIEFNTGALTADITGSFFILPSYSSVGCDLEVGT